MASNQWFRSWHGAPMDPKWQKIARRASVQAGVVSAIVWAMFDHASKQDDRGDVSTFDVEEYSVFSGFEETQIASVIRSMIDCGVIVDGRFDSWEKRQPMKDEATSATRMARLRQRRREDGDRSDGRVTSPNVTLRRVTTDKRRVEKILPDHENHNSESDSENPSHLDDWDDLGRDSSMAGKKVA